MGNDSKVPLSVDEELIKPPQIMETFEAGDTVFSKEGEDIQSFLERLLPRWMYLTNRDSAEFSSYIYMREDGESSKYAVSIETLGLPQLSFSSTANTPDGYKVVKGSNGEYLTVHSHGPKTKWSKDLAKKTLNVLKSLRNNGHISKAKYTRLKSDYYDGPNTSGSKIKNISGDMNRFSPHDGSGWLMTMKKGVINQ